MALPPTGYRQQCGGSRPSRMTGFWKFNRNCLAATGPRQNLDAGCSGERCRSVVLPDRYLRLRHRVSMKVTSNYTNRLAQTPVDDAFQKYEWQKAV